MNTISLNCCTHVYYKTNYQRQSIHQVQSEKRSVIHGLLQTPDTLARLNGVKCFMKLHSYLQGNSEKLQNISWLFPKQNLNHTTYKGQNEWSRILTLEITIFGLKIMVKSGLDFEILCGNSAGRPWQIFFCTGQQQL